MKTKTKSTKKFFLFSLLLLAVFMCSNVSADSLITRQILNDATINPEIIVTVTPDSSTTSYFVKEFLIAEINPTHISGGGIIDYSEGCILWGPFDDNLPRTFTYKIMGSTTGFEIPGFARFSSDPPAQNPKSYYKVLTEGDKIGTLIVPIQHSIAELNPGTVYTVTTQHLAIYDGQPLQIPYFYPELHILNALRNNIIGIRAFSGPEGTGYATFQKTTPYTTPIAWNIPELEVISVTATQLANPAALEVAWTFRLSPTVLWNVDGASICIGIFTMTDAGDFGAFCDLSNLNYTGGMPKIFSGKRGIYVWKEGYNVATNPVNQRDFFSFCSAPKGAGSNKIESIIIALPQDINGAESPLFRAFIAEAHSRGCEVHFVTGEPEWSFEYNRQIGVDDINKIFTFNQQAAVEERFDSIQFDIEPHAIDTDNEPGMEPWVWAEYIPTMAFFKSVIDQNNASTGLNIPFSAAIGNFWHEDYVPADAYTGPGFQQILNIIDKAQIMNYVTNHGAVYTCRDEINYARSLNKPVDIVYETFNTSPTESFWFNGNNALERMLTTIDYAYFDPISPNYYENLEYNIIHYYEADDEVWAHNGVVKRSYRQLREDIFSPQEPITPTYNTAPVCYVNYPNGGEVINTSTDTITYTLYDDDPSTPIAVKFYLANSTQGTEYFLGEETVTVNASLSYNGSYSLNASAYPLVSGYRIRIEVTEQSGIPANDLSSYDQSNFDFEISSSSSSNTAPVCTVTYPNGGEVLTPPSMTITYTITDDNPSIPINVRFYLVNQGTEYYLGQQTINVNSSLIHNGSYTKGGLNAYPKTTGYRIRIDATEQSGTPALSGSDLSDGTFEIKKRGK
ncbi:MAG: hypothetical protein H7A34_03410 [bacterium]|nr:hypothetical protein [bacterium]